MGDDPETSDPQYKRLLEFLFDRYVRPRASALRGRFREALDYELSYELSRAIRASRMLRFMEVHFDSPGDVSRAFTLEALQQTFHDVHGSSAFAERIARDGGFLDAYEADLDGILAGIRAEQLPEIDKEVLREIGTTDADIELDVLVRGAETVLRRVELNTSDRPVSQQLKQAYVRTERAAKEIDEAIERSKAGKVKEIPKKSRRWYKGFGQIGQGAALTIANAGIAFGAIHFPVSPETQTWGALLSVVTGIGTILSGVGDLRNE